MDRVLGAQAPRPMKAARPKKAAEAAGRKQVGQPGLAGHWATEAPGCIQARPPSKPARGTKLNIPLYMSQEIEFSSPHVLEYNMVIHWRVKITLFHITFLFNLFDQN